MRDTPLAEEAERVAQQFVVTAEVMADHDKPKRAERAFEAAEDYYVQAGLDPEWFGSSHAARTCSRPTIPGYE